MNTILATQVTRRPGGCSPASIARRWALRIRRWLPVLSRPCSSAEQVRRIAAQYQRAGRLEEALAMRTAAEALAPTRTQQAV